MYDDKPHASALRKGRVSEPGQAYFVTKCALGPFLERPDCARVVVDSLLWARDNGWWRILGFVVMPTHYHVTFGLGDVKTLSDAMYSVDRFTATSLNRILGRSGSLWEQGFYDHAIRDRVDFDGILAYIHANPVVAGLVESEEQWLYSTANVTYLAEIDWEWLGPAIPRFVSDARRFDEQTIAARYR